MEDKWFGGQELRWRDRFGETFGLGVVDFSGSARTWRCAGEVTGGVCQFARSFRLHMKVGMPCAEL